MTLTGKTQQTVDQERYEQEAQNVRRERDRLIAASDWTQLPDAPEWIDHEAWTVYRQALRDVPQQEGFPFDVVWPEQAGDQ